MVHADESGGAGGGKVMNFGKSRARRYDEEKLKITFKDVAGAEEAKQELEEVVEFLKHPQKYNDLGAKIPKGVLLYGLRVQAKPCWRRQLPVKQEFRSSVFPVLTLWKCLSVSALRVYATVRPGKEKCTLHRIYR